MDTLENIQNASESVPRIRLILGGPGTGKTTRVLSIVEELLSRGVAPEDIAFVSFTRQAVREAVDRAIKKFKFSKKRFPYFRTIHSLAFQHVGARREGIMQKEHYSELGTILGLGFSGHQGIEDDFQDRTLGDKLMFVEGVSRLMSQDLLETWHTTEADVDWFQLKLFADTLQRYKNEKGLRDFTDLLKEFHGNGGQVPVEYAIVDEAQDLSRIQWNVIDSAFRGCKEIILAGDDDQAIYRWAGSDQERFLSVKYDEKEVLPISYRLPKDVFDLANDVSSRIVERYSKEWRPEKSSCGIVYCRNLEGIPIDNNENWLLLSRNKFHSRIFQTHCEELGLPYQREHDWSVNQDHVQAIQLYENHLRKGEEVSADQAELVLKMMSMSSQELPETVSLKKLFGKDPGIWHDVFEGISVRKREYYLSILRSGRKLTDVPKIRLDTIHGAKGSECENVVLVTDMTERTFQNFLQVPDDEHRCFYVGITRTKNNLYVVAPMTRKGYEIF